MIGVHCLQRAFLAAIVTMAVGGAARAAEQVFDYTITHPKYGTIGTYTNVVNESAGGYRVRTRVHIQVKAMGFTLYRQDADRLEEWRGDRLISFQGVTETNGKRLEITGQAQGDAFVINLPDETLVAPGDVTPVNPWATASRSWTARATQGQTIMSTTTGKLYAATVSGGDERSVTLNGAARRLREFDISFGDKRDVVWVDRDGLPVAFRTIENGAPVDLVLTRRSRDDSIIDLISSAFLP